MERSDHTYMKGFLFREKRSHGQSLLIWVDAPLPMVAKPFHATSTGDDMLIFYLFIFCEVKYVYAYDVGVSVQHKRHGISAYALPSTIGTYAFKHTT